MIPSTAFLCLLTSLPQFKLGRNVIELQEPNREIFTSLSYASHQLSAAAALFRKRDASTRAGKGESNSGSEEEDL